MKNLYKIKSYYVITSSEDINIEEYVCSDSETIFKYFSTKYNIISDDLEEVKENDGEIGLEDNDYDSYYEETIYGFELVKENISKEEAEKYVLEQFLSYS